MASPELSQVVNLVTKADGTDANAQMRGVGPNAWELRPQVRIVEGRKFNPGMRELVVGEGAKKQYVGLDVGNQVELGNQMWTVVGTFASGDSHDSELWADSEVVANTYRLTAFQSVTVKLDGKDGFDKLKAAMAADLRLKLDVDTTRHYYSKQSEDLTRFIEILGIVVGTIMAIGAVFGALNTMYAAVAGRAREVATMRAIGFRGLPVVVAVMLETMLLALLGGAARRRDRLAGVQRLHRLDAGLELQPGDVPVPGLARAALERAQVGARHRPRGRPVPRTARSAPPGDRGVARGLTRVRNMDFVLADIGLNLAHDSFDADRERVMADAWNVGVRFAVITGSTLESSRAAVELVRAQPQFLRATAGVHPHHAREFRDDDVPELAAASCTARSRCRRRMWPRLFPGLFAARRPGARVPSAARACGAERQARVPASARCARRRSWASCANTTPGSQAAWRIASRATPRS